MQQICFAVALPLLCLFLSHHLISLARSVFFFPLKDSALSSHSFSISHSLSCLSIFSVPTLPHRRMRNTRQAHSDSRPHVQESSRAWEARERWKDYNQLSLLHPATRHQNAECRRSDISVATLLRELAWGFFFSFLWGITNPLHLAFGSSITTQAVCSSLMSLVRSEGS